MAAEKEAAAELIESDPGTWYNCVYKDRFYRLVKKGGLEACDLHRAIKFNKFQFIESVQNLRQEAFYLGYLRNMKC